jgi:hypothetical protein
MQDSCRFSFVFAFAILHQLCMSSTRLIQQLSGDTAPYITQLLVTKAIKKKQTHQQTHG